jgi:hypothetical protein
MVHICWSDNSYVTIFSVDDIFANSIYKLNAWLILLK